MTANGNATKDSYGNGDGLNTSGIALVTLISTVLVFATIVLLIVVFNHVEEGVVFVKDTSRPYQELHQLRHQQLGSLADYGLLNREKQSYAIPISRAMELTIQRRRENPIGPPGTPMPDAVELPTEEPSDGR